MLFLIKTKKTYQLEKRRLVLFFVIFEWSDPSDTLLKPTGVLIC